MSSIDGSAPSDRWDWSLITARCKAEALRILRQPADAEEAAQEALARAWRSRHTCRTPDAPLAWCAQIARNEALRIITRRNAEARLGTLEDELEIEDVATTYESARAGTRIDLHRALDALTPHERLLIGLRFSYDWSHSDIAAELGITEATARVRLHRAQKRLRTLL